MCDNVRTWRENSGSRRDLMWNLSWEEDRETDRGRRWGSVCVRHERLAKMLKLAHDSREVSVLERRTGCLETAVFDTVTSHAKGQNTSHLPAYLHGRFGTFCTASHFQKEGRKLQVWLHAETLNSQRCQISPTASGGDNSLCSDHASCKQHLYGLTTFFRETSLKFS